MSDVYISFLCRFSICYVFVFVVSFGVRFTVDSGLVVLVHDAVLHKISYILLVASADVDE